MPSLVLVWLFGVRRAHDSAAEWLALGAADEIARHRTRCRTLAGGSAVRLSRRLHIATPVRLLESTLVDVPTVIGWLKPVLLLPASALAGLAPHQLEAILAHELAHVRRHDYLVNLLQTRRRDAAVLSPGSLVAVARAFAPSARTAATISRSRCAATVSHTRGRLPISKSSAEPAAGWCSPRMARRSCTGSGGCSARRPTPKKLQRGSAADSRSSSCRALRRVPSGPRRSAVRPL